MTNNLLKNFIAAAVIIITVGVGDVCAEYKSKLSVCKDEDAVNWTNCFGTYVFTSGDKYKGEWKDGKKNGRGTYTWANGAKCESSYREDLTIGISDCIQNNGDRYVGEVDGKGGYSGFGIYYFIGDFKGDRYEGEWKEGNFNGQGTYYYHFNKDTRGDRYIGEYKNGIKNGIGTYYFANGDKFVGEFKGNKNTGYVIYYFLSENRKKGDKYEGEWVLGNANGFGVYTKKNGNRYEGNWENGKFIKEAKVNLANINLANININQIESKNKKYFEHELQKLADKRQKFEEEKLNRAQSQNNKRINIHVTNTQPDINGTLNITIKTNADTASLKINDEEQGGRADGNYTIRKVARAGQETKFIIAAVDINGNTDSKTISVTRQVTASSQIKYTALNPALVKTQLNKDAVAIIIGIADYKNLPRADYANDDARAFYDYAIRGLGVKPENIKLLVDTDAGQEEIYKAFKTWLPARVRANTDVYVYYSGHGITTNDGQSLYLLPQRTDRDLIEDTAVAQSRINTAIQATKPKSVTIFLDSCYSGAARTGATLLASARPISLKANTQTFPADFTVFTASTAEQISSSSNELKHGIFSYYLMKGMEGDADANKDGKITAGEMHGYLTENVAKQASLTNRVQQPQLTGDANRVLVGKQ